MDKKYNKQNVVYAKELRKNMTKEEKHLWYDFLKNYPIKFTRQKVMGKYILDFYCAYAKLAIELDGSQHYEEDNQKYDEERTKYLNQYGINVVRILNIEIHKNFEGVCRYIDIKVKEVLDKRKKQSPQSADADSSP